MSRSTIAPVRLAVIRGALAVGTFAIVVVESLSATHRLTGAAIATSWFAAIAATAAGVVVAVRRGRWRLPRPASGWHRVRDAWRSASRPERVGWGVLAALLLAELIVAVLAEPNNFDSQTYHLPRVSHWVANGNIGFYPTAIHRQVTLPPGAEFLLLHLRLLSGGDAFYNLVQFAAGLGCLVAATRITAQLGGTRRAQLVTALLVGTTPMVVLQASSTQNDLVVAAWTGCLGTLVLDSIGRRARIGDVLGLGAALGLVTVTKTSGCLAAGPLLVLWGVGQLRLLPVRSGVRRAAGGLAATAAASLVILAVGAAVAGPYLARVSGEFGDPLGPPQLRNSIPMQRHDPAAVLINALRIGQTALDTPFAPLRRATLAGTEWLADRVGVPLNDPDITFTGMSFPEPAWYPDEDRVSFPITGTLALVASVAALCRPRRRFAHRPRLSQGYAAVIVVAGVLYAATVKWQISGNRLLLFLLVLSVPLAGVWLDQVSRAPGRAVTDAPRPAVTGAIAVVLAVSALAGWLTVGYGFPRRLVGAGSVFTTSPQDTRFLRRPLWADDYAWAAGQVEAAGARRVGIVEANNDWEYPWWVLLPGRDLVSLRSVLPKHPPPAPNTVSAIICTAPDYICVPLIPAGWTTHRQGVVAVATPPA